MTTDLRNPLPWGPISSTGSVPILLVRHGQTARNREHRFNGRDDVPLNVTGHFQARRLSIRLSKIPLQAVYSSPLQRALQTVAPILDARDLSPQIDERLAEVDQGELDGLYGPDFPRLYPALCQAWRTDPSDVQLPRGEDGGSGGDERRLAKPETPPGALPPSSGETLPPKSGKGRDRAGAGLRDSHGGGGSGNSSSSSSSSLSHGSLPTTSEEGGSEAEADNGAEAKAVKAHGAAAAAAAAVADSHQPDNTGTKQPATESSAKKNQVVPLQSLGGESGGDAEVTTRKEKETKARAGNTSTATEGKDKAVDETKKAEAKKTEEGKDKKGGGGFLSRMFGRGKK